MGDMADKLKINVLVIRVSFMFSRLPITDEHALRTLPT